MHKESFPVVAALVDSSTLMNDFIAGTEDSNGLITISYPLAALMRKIAARCENGPPTLNP
jgi:hypothetical protein